MAIAPPIRIPRNVTGDSIGICMLIVVILLGSVTLRYYVEIVE